MESRVVESFQIPRRFFNRRGRTPYHDGFLTVVVGNNEKKNLRIRFISPKIFKSQNQHFFRENSQIRALPNQFNSNLKHNHNEQSPKM